MRRKVRVLALLLAIVCAVVACEEKKEIEVITNEVTEITANSAKCGGVVTSEGYKVGACGICWSETPNPTTNNHFTSDINGDGSYVSVMSELKPSTKYYVRAYATTDMGTMYGEEKEFTTIKDKENDGKPVVTTKEVSNITVNSAISGGNVTDDGGHDVTLRGVCWSTSQNPTVEGNHTEDGSGTGEFTNILTDLTPNTTYYVRAYATNEEGTSYGDEKSFTTGESGNYEKVDLGLPSGLKWATCNVGAATPEDYGSYYAWGELLPKGEYTTHNSMTYEEQMNDISGNPQYDAATANWGGDWRMPTQLECQELVDECTWEFTTRNEVNGYKVTGPNGSHIFLPSAGYRFGLSHDGEGEYGHYWSSTPHERDNKLAYDFIFGAENYDLNVRSRDIGLTVRPVLGEGLKLPTVITSEVINVTRDYAECGGNVTDDGGMQVTFRGVCWSTSSNPTINDDHTIDGSGAGEFTSNLTDLMPNTTYYVRAYATNGIGIGYGNEMIFTTEEIKLPIVITREVTNIASNYAECGGNVIDGGDMDVTAYGVCWSTSSNPTINDDYTVDGSGVGEFISNITGLTPNTTYYVRAYATTEDGTGYGEEYSFITILNQIGGYDYVDLGLPSGLKWAMYNIGAENEEDLGNYYSWGEIEIKDEYTDANCMTCGMQLDDISGNPTYDAAAANWGSTWRMPKMEEYQELLDECTWEWTQQNEMYGYKVIGPNGNHIFLPLPGYKYESTYFGANEMGYYWSSTPYTEVDRANYLFLYQENFMQMSNFIRASGQAIRPVSE